MQIYAEHKDNNMYISIDLFRKDDAPGGHKYLMRCIRGGTTLFYVLPELGFRLLHLLSFFIFEEKII